MLGKWKAGFCTRNLYGCGAFTFLRLIFRVRWRPFTPAAASRSARWPVFTSHECCMIVIDAGSCNCERPQQCFTIRYTSVREPWHCHSSGQQRNMARQQP